MANPANPSAPGALAFDKVVYAASGLNYGADPQLGQFTAFDAPTPAFVTRRVDLSAFADLGAFTPWPFSNTDVPINGHACLPRGTGPFPLAIFAHGNHDPFENSTPGYLYLCELLASHGIAAATIDVNFLNGQNFGENDGRAIVHLEHIRQFALWNAQPGHPLYGRIDLNRIMIVGHSRGGEAVGHASVFNRLASVQPDANSPPVALDGTAGLGPYRFAINAAVAIAPTDRQYIPVAGPSRVADNYLILHGSRDADVFNFPGYRTYDRSHPIDLQDPEAPPGGYKALVWLHRANHNFFNSTWSQEATAPTLARSDQELMAKIYIASFAFAELKGMNEYLGVLKDPRLAASAGWSPAGIALATQFQPTHRVFAQHFEEPGSSLVVSAPVAGTVGAVGAVARKLRFDLGSTSHLNQETSGLRVSWSAQPARYEITIDPDTVSLNSFHHFALRVGQSSEPENAAGSPQDFTLSFEDGALELSLTVGTLHDLVYPDEFPELGTRPKTVMQTVIVPFERLSAAGLDVTRLRKIAFVFDRTDSGMLYLDDIQFGS